MTGWRHVHLARWQSHPWRRPAARASGVAAYDGGKRRQRRSGVMAASGNQGSGNGIYQHTLALPERRTILMRPEC